MIKEKCERCEYSKHKGSLTEHHKDGNHQNNAPENIKILCFNCHFELHHNGEVKIKRKPKDPNNKTKKALYKEVETLKTKIFENLQNTKTIIDTKVIPENGLLQEIEKYKYELRKIRLRYLRAWIYSRAHWMNSTEFKAFEKPNEIDIKHFEKYEDYLNMSFDEDDIVLTKILTTKPKWIAEELEKRRIRYIERQKDCKYRVYIYSDLIKCNIPNHKEIMCRCDSCQMK